MVTSGIFHEKSVSFALAAIEIYNKPNFAQRSEVFSILLINAWEALLKGKLLLDNSENLESLYIPISSGGFKTNRAGAPMTLELIGCARRIGLPDVVLKNLTAIIEVRDNSIHFVNSESVDYLVFTLGVACLKNYHRLCKEWFGDSIDQYNFYIFPLGFVYNFKSLKLLELEKEEEAIQNILKRITNHQREVNSGPYEFNCEIEVNLKSAKNITHSTDLEISVNSGNTATATIIKDRVIVDSYPLTATDLYKAVKSEIPEIKRNEFFQYIAEKGLKDDRKYSSYLFRNRRQKVSYEQNGTVPKSISSLYNHDCLRLVILDLRSKNAND